MSSNSQGCNSPAIASEAKSELRVFGHSIEGWPATLLVYLIWLAPALLVALMMLRIKMTCA